MRRLLTFCAGALVSAAWCGPVSAEDLALFNATVHTVSGGVLQNAVIHVSGDRIVGIGPAARPPENARRIECRGKIVTPGLIESASQIGLVEIPAIEETNDSDFGGDPIRAAARMDDAIDLRSALVGVARRQGVTSAIAAPVGGLVSGRSAWLDLLDGSTPAWRDAVIAPVAMHASVGQAGAAAAGGSRALTFLRLREVLEDARFYARERDSFRKNALRKLAVSYLDLEALLDVVSGKLPLVVRVHKASDILAVLRFAREQKIRVALEGAEEGWQVADAIAKDRAPVLIQPLDDLPSSFEELGARMDNAAILHRAGVEVAITTQSSHNVGTLRFLLGNAVRAGLPHDAALAAATLVPARIFGQAAAYGSIEPGKVANLVVWSGDPFEPASAAEVVIIRGRTQSVESRQTRLMQRYKARLGL